MRTEGLTYRAIADTLTDENVPTARGATRWSAPTVRSALGEPRATKQVRSTDLPEIKPRRRTTTRKATK